MEQQDSRYANLQAIVDQINASYSFTKAYLDTHTIRPIVTLEAGQGAGKTVIDHKLAKSLKQLLDDPQLGCLHVRHSKIMPAAMPQLIYAISKNRTAIEISLCSERDAQAPNIVRDLTHAMLAAENPNLEVFRPAPTGIRLTNTNTASSYVDKIFFTPNQLSVKEYREIRNRLPLIETLARTRFTANTQGLEKFAVNLQGIAALAHRNDIEIDVAPFYRKFPKNVIAPAPQPAAAPYPQVTGVEARGRTYPVGHESIFDTVLDYNRRG